MWVCHAIWATFAIHILQSLQTIGLLLCIFLLNADLFGVCVCTCACVPSISCVLCMYVYVYAFIFL